MYPPNDIFIKSSLADKHKYLASIFSQLRDIFPTSKIFTNIVMILSVQDFDHAVYDNIYAQVDFSIKAKLSEKMTKDYNKYLDLKEENILLEKLDQENAENFLFQLEVGGEI